MYYLRKGKWLCWTKTSLQMKAKASLVVEITIRHAVTDPARDFERAFTCRAHARLYGASVTVQYSKCNTDCGS